MKRSTRLLGIGTAITLALFASYALREQANGQAAAPGSNAPTAASQEFPEGTATPSELCGGCHKSIYREYSQGESSDFRWGGMKTNSSSSKALTLPAGTPPAATAHAVAGIDPWPLDAIQVEENGRKCNVCHYNEPLVFPDMAAAKIEKPKARATGHEQGVTCASCHLTPDGKIRGSYEVNAPHATVKEPAIRTSVACAYCHSDGERVVGKQTQTFLEWREDFNKAGLGPQHCQDCHMPRTVRKLAEDFDVPARVVARHVPNGGHSFNRLSGVLALKVDQVENGGAKLALQLTNVGAGHSVPTGSNRRAVYLIVEVLDAGGKVVASKEWMFAPSFADRPDDRAFLEEDRKLPQAFAARQADAQGPHESIIRAGEQRVLDWTPELGSGRYRVRARLIHDLNRYNDREFKDDQTEIAQAVVDISVAKR